MSGNGKILDVMMSGLNNRTFWNEILNFFYILNDLYDIFILVNLSKLNEFNILSKLL